MQINRINLQQARMAKGLSLERLADSAKVDKQTIHRIEKGKAVQQRQLTVDRLAKALSLTVEQLCGPTLDAADLARKRDRPAASSQLNTKMPNNVRNALALVASRYGVKMNQIVQASPFLFMWAAESSLNKRKRDLGALVEAHEIAQSRIPDHAGWACIHPGDYDQFLNMESHSIMANDLFARELVPDLNGDTPVPSDNPFAKFLQQLVKDLPDDCSFQGWEPEFGPDYRICESGALDLVGGDKKATNYLLNGRVGLHEIPSEVQSSGAKCIADWIVEVGAEREAAANAALQEWRAKLSDKQKKVFDSIDRTIEDNREQAK